MSAFEQAAFDNFIADSFCLQFASYLPHGTYGPLLFLRLECLVNNMRLTLLSNHMYLGVKVHSQKVSFVASLRHMSIWNPRDIFPDKFLSSEHTKYEM